jgi:nicotinate-nucleotide adenylyltransferase
MTNNGILLFGGTFDPIHNGHLQIVKNVAEQLRVDRAVLIPTSRPPHKNGEEITSAEHRLAMCRLATHDEPALEVSDCELQREGVSYTIDTLDHFRGELGSDVQLYWLIGADTIKELPTWYRIGELADKCTLVTAARPGYDWDDLESLHGVLSDRQIAQIKSHVLNTPLVDISSTDLRRLFENGCVPAGKLPGSVEAYIRENKLYGSS